MVSLHVPDPDAELSAVRLASDLALPDEERAFERRNGEWVLELRDRHVTRLEYLVELEHADGTSETVPNPGSPASAPGAFGEKSVWTAPGYEPPWWLEPSREPVPSGLTDLPVASRAVKATIGVRIWAPADAETHEPLPLLLAHDGPEYDALSSLTRWAGIMVGDSELPRFRVALLEPGPRDDWYSASPPYARALCTEVVPALRRAFSVRGRPVGIGSSLGGLAMLHAQRRHPRTFGGLFLQSASFFNPRFDAHEQRFPGYGRIVRFTRGVLRATSHGETVPVVLTCGSEEENIHNNRLMCAALGRQGYEADLVEVGDTHNYTAWRDAFDPHLTALLMRVWES